MRSFVRNRINVTDIFKFLWNLVFTRHFCVNEITMKQKPALYFNDLNDFEESYTRKVPEEEGMVFQIIFRVFL